MLKNRAGFTNHELRTMKYGVRGRKVGADSPTMEEWRNGGMEEWRLEAGGWRLEARSSNKRLKTKD